MSEEKKRLVAIGIAVFAIWSFTHHKPAHNVPAAEVRPIGWFDGVDVQLVKIDLFAKKLEEQERELSVIRNERMMQAASRPLLDEDLIKAHRYVSGVDSPLLCEICGLAEGNGIHTVKPMAFTIPLINTSLTAQPVTPGMEPAKEPVKSTPAVTYAQPAKAFGRWERYGFLGRRRRWVSENSQVYQQYAVSWQPPPRAQKAGVPVLRRFGSCRGSSCP